MKSEEKKLLFTILNSLNKNKQISFKYLPFETPTNSLYRFGWFLINGRKYSVSAINYKKNIVVFEDDKEYKVKYNYKEHKIVYNKFRRLTFFDKMKYKLASYLGSLSERLYN